MASWPDDLRTQTPRTGKHIKENADDYNLADHFYNERLSSNDAALRAGAVWQSAFRGQIPANDTLYFAQTVVDEVRGISFSAKIIGGPVEVEQYDSVVEGVVLETLETVNGDRRILTESSNKFRRLDGFSGGRFVESTFDLSPSSGTGRSSANLTSAGIGGIYGPGTAAAFSFTNSSSQDVEISIAWVWKEPFV